MKCALCNGNINHKQEAYPFRSKALGIVLIPGASFQQCDHCGDKTFSPSESQRLFDYVSRKEREVIEKLPIRDFVSAGEAAVILGISKQAFSKNPKIKRGFIYSVRIGDRKYFSKKSVLQFKETNDGRYSLSWGKVPLFKGGAKRKKTTEATWGCVINKDTSLLLSSPNYSDENNDDAYATSA
jgi:hypothetical protein